jgi:hypothetical protein
MIDVTISRSESMSDACKLKEEVSIQAKDLAPIRRAATTTALYVAVVIKNL